MATPYRGYTEVPGSIAPDVPYRINLALREIDADLETALAELDETDAAAAGRLAALESAAGFGSGMKLQDDAVNALLLSSTTKTTGTLTKQIEAKSAAATLKELDTEGAPLREALDALVLGHLGDNFPGVLAPWGQALRNSDTVPALWVSLGSSTANGGNTPNFGLSWVGRIATYLTGRNVLDAAVIQLDTKPARPSKGINVYNGAVGGTSAANYLDAAKLAAIKTLQPTLITHMVGANDLGYSTTPATYKTNLRNWMDQLQAASPGTVHLMIHQQGRVAPSPKYAWKLYGQAMREVAELYPNVAFLDANERFGFRGGLEAHLVSDDLHMNEYGHRVMADLVAEAMGNPIPYVHQEKRKVPNAGSLTVVTAGTWLSYTVPPAPYPRKLTVEATLFGYGTGAKETQGPEFAIVAEYAGGITAGDAQQIRLLNGGASHALSYTAAPTWSVDANRELTVKVNVGDGAYISGSGPYTRIYANLVPA